MCGKFLFALYARLFQVVQRLMIRLQLLAEALLVFGVCFFLFYQLVLLSFGLRLGLIILGVKVTQSHLQPVANEAGKVGGGYASFLDAMLNIVLIGVDYCWINIRIFIYIPYCVKCFLKNVLILR